MSRPITRVGRPDVTSCTNSTSGPSSAASSTSSRQMARIWGSMSAMTDALKVSASGLR